MSEAYKKQVRFLFSVNGEQFSITNAADGWVEIEETRKNGQEDSHMIGVLEKDADGKWQWGEGKELFDCYAGKKQSKAIIDYINENEPPDHD